MHAYDSNEELLSSLKNETSNEIIIRKIRKAAFITANIISSICLWRQQQWSPRPLIEIFPSD